MYQRRIKTASWQHHRAVVRISDFRREGARANVFPALRISALVIGLMCAHVSNVGAYVLVSDQTSDQILKLDETTLTLLGTWNSPVNLVPGIQIGEIHLGRDNNVYALDLQGSDDKVLKLDGFTGELVGSFGPFIDPVDPSRRLFEAWDVAMGPDHNLYVTDDGGNSVKKIDTSNGTLTTFASGGGLADPRGLTFGPDGNLYVVSLGSDNIKRFHGTTGAFIGNFSNFDSTFQPHDITFGPDGNGYVTSTFGQVIKINGTTGADMGLFISQLGFPTYGINFGGDKLCVANDDKVSCFNATTGQLLADEGGLGSPFGVAFTPTIPEPSTLILLALAALTIVCRRSRTGSGL